MTNKDLVTKFFNSPNEASHENLYFVNYGARVQPAKSQFHRLLYSYGTHYPLGYLFKDLLIVSTTKSSVTTAKHRSLLLAQSQGYKVVELPLNSSDPSKPLLTWLRELLKQEKQNEVTEISIGLATKVSHKAKLAQSYYNLTIHQQNIAYLYAAIKKIENISIKD